MFEINTKNIKSLSYIQKITSFFKELLQYDFLYNCPKRYILLSISPFQIQLYTMNGILVECDEIFLQTEMDKLLSFLERDKNLPIYCILNGWDLDIKTLNLKNAHIIDRYLAQSHFKTGSFLKSDTVICRASQNKDVYLFIALNENESLKDMLKHLSFCKNIFIGFDYGETLLLKNVLEKNPTFLNTQTIHIIFKKTEKTWQIILSLGHDIVLCRHGVYDGYFNFLQEILNTKNYIPSLGINVNMPIVLYAQSEIFSRIVLAQNGIDLFELKDIENYIFQIKPESMIYNLFNKIKKLNFIKTTPSFKDFFYHRFFYEFPKNSFIAQTILSVFLLIGLGIHMAQITYFELENETIKNKITENKKQTKSQADQLFAQHFLPFYQKNPIIRIKELAKHLPDNMIVDKIHFTQDITTVNLKIKNPHNDDSLKTLQSTLEKATNLKISLEKNQKNIIILKMAEKK